MYVSSEGKKGDAVWGTRGPWICSRARSEPSRSRSRSSIIRGTRAFRPIGTRAGYGLFAANPLGQKTLEDGNVEITLTLQKGESATFRYRILILSAAPDAQAIERESKAFMELKRTY